MRRQVWLLLLGIGLCLFLIPKEDRAGGIGISSPPEHPPSGTQQPQAITDVFHPKRVGNQGMFRQRDLEFLWDSLYSSGRGYHGFTLADLALLDSLGASIADRYFNPFGAPYPDIRLVHDYFNDIGATYDANPSHPHGFFIGATTDPDSDRSHVDFYVYLPGHDGLNYGQTTSAFATAKEDSITGHWGITGRRDTVLHENSIMMPGPPLWQVGSSTWTQPDYGMNGGFNHEFQHAQDHRSFVMTEIASAGAEAIAGHHPVDPISLDAPYTWPLIAYDSLGCRSCTELQCIKWNYQAWRLFSAYLAYGFRGRDTTAALPAGPVVGFGDDLFYQWAHSGGGLSVLPYLLSDQACYTCSTATYFHPGGASLDGDARLGLMLHNWRVANFVNNSSFAEGQYGFPPQFGFTPKVDVGAWQSLDGCGAQDDGVAIPPEITLSGGQRTVEITRVGMRTWANGLYAYPMTLQPLGSEYWVVRSDASLGGGGQDLVVRATPEGVHRDVFPGVFDGCSWNAQPQQADARLFASIVGYSEEDVLGQPDSLWKHPEWATLALPAQWVDVDSTARALEFVIPDFGRTHKAAVIVLSLGDGPSRYYTSLATIERYIPALPYRVSLSLRGAPFQAQNPMPVATQPGVSDDFASWSPTGDEIVYHSAIGLSYSQIYRRSLDGSPATPLIPQPRDQEGPDWSPRGDWVAYSELPTSAQEDLWIYNTQTQTPPVRLTFLPGYAYLPAFQPNGQRLAYLHFSGNGLVKEIRRINLDGSGDVLLAALDSLPNARVRWSADGQWIYFTRNEVLYMLPAEGGAPIRREGLIPRVAAFDLRPGDGRLAAEEPSESPYRSICNVDTTLLGLPFRRLAIRDTLAGDSEPRFYRAGVEFFNPRWSPDGTRVVYTADDNRPGDRDLFVGQVSFDHAPRFSPAPRDTALALPCAPYTFTMDLSASDPDGEAVGYQAAYLPPGASLNGNHFTWPNPGPPGGDHYIVFRALDGSGGLDSRVVKLALLPDLAPPGAAQDVTIATGRYSATVTWTAPGDDGLIGTACRYDLRYSTSPITEGNFSSLADTVATPAPDPAGAMQCVEVAALAPCTWYYFALKTRDDAGQWSTLSNVGAGKTQCSGYADAFCDGGLYAQGGGGGGWSPETALLDGVSTGTPVRDGYRLQNLLAVVSGRYELRLLNTSAGPIALDEVALATVDHSSATEVFLAGSRAVTGTASPAFRVSGPGGEDLTQALDGTASLPHASTTGEVLLVRLSEGGAPGEALLLETAAGGPSARPDSTGILIQVPELGGSWTTVARHVPRRRFDRFVADSLPSGTVRLVFLGEHQIRFVGKVVKGGAVGAQRPALHAALHSRLGDVSAAVAAAGGTSTVLAAGDALTLSFAAPLLAANQSRDWLLFVGGAQAAQAGALAARRSTEAAEAPPARFALYQNQPNPFAASTTFRFDLPREEWVRLEVFDLLGRRVAVVRNAWMPAGRHAADWDAHDAGGVPARPGVYLYRIGAGSHHAQRKLVVLP
jgi:hypothetical protein